LQGEVREIKTQETVAIRFLNKTTLLVREGYARIRGRWKIRESLAGVDYGGNVGEYTE